MQNGNTSLMKASEENHLDVVKYLVGKGADVKAKDNVSFPHITHSHSLQTFFSIEISLIFCWFSDIFIDMF